ncbi:hypothetical protein J5N97_015675 [Dioscorea zingiberensis]|uniref:Uncharacterized protein n=1 Tax=Dioscorea zingiberensis TaxID=325984 RepID=A0A9D5HET6_9LILI|nr:hypothetical protein J5N97_015675 [Dioscorea zingiberensis]
MDQRNSAEVLKHLEKQNETLMETYRVMSHDLHKLQVEEEMLMRKLYELMTAEGLIKKKKEDDEPNRALTITSHEN